MEQKADHLNDQSPSLLVDIGIEVDGTVGVGPDVSDHVKKCGRAGWKDTSNRRTAMSTADVLSSANALLDAHNVLLRQVRSKQRVNRSALRAYLSTQPSTTRDPDSPNDLKQLLELPLLRTPPTSPPPDYETLDDKGKEQEGGDISAVVSSVVRPHPREVRPDLPPAKKARCARYENYIPEEETIRNDYCQRYVDGGEWPQNWVVGAEMERRFEE